MTINKGWLFGLGLLALAGCRQLDQVPEATATKTAVFGSEGGLNLYANSFYGILPDGGTVIRSDEMADYSARTQAPDFLRAGAFSSRQSSGWDWRALRNINYFLENNVSATVPAETRRHYSAMARFFRAWFYFDKVKRFGDVPWVNRTIAANDSALYQGRDPRTLVMDSVLADLNYACQHLRATADPSRTLINRNLAYGLKSRVCLFEGTFRKYNTSYQLGNTADRWLTEAASAAETVMKTGAFSISEAQGTTGSYRQLFTNKTPVANEIMLSAVADANLSVFNDANWWWTSATYGSRVSLTRTFVNTYLTVDGTPFTATPNYQTKPFAEEVKNRDRRLQQTIRLGSYQRINGGTAEAAPPVFSYTYTGYQPIKWALDDTYYDGGTRNDNSISIMRYAEMLLNYAEARAELGTLTDDDWTRTVGALRKRAGISGGLTSRPTTIDTYLQTTYFPGISNAPLLEIRRERGIELVLEGFRFPDLLRWHRGDLLTLPWNGFYVPALDKPMDLNEDGKNDVYFYKDRPATPALAGVTYINVSPTVNGVTNPQRLSNDTSGELTWLTNIPRVWTEKNYLYPIPEADRQVNPRLGQNPGW